MPPQGSFCFGVAVGLRADACHPPGTSRTPLLMVCLLYTSHCSPLQICSYQILSARQRLPSHAPSAVSYTHLGSASVPAPAMQPPGQAMPSSRYPLYLPAFAIIIIVLQSARPWALMTAVSYTHLARTCRAANLLRFPPPGARETESSCASSRHARTTCRISQ